MAAIDALSGMDGVKHELNRLIAMAQAQRARGAQGLGSEAPAVAILLAGPRGVGKTSLARQIAPLFCGLGAIPTPNLVEGGAAELSPRLGGSLAERAQALAERALDGVLLLDDMDWMLKDDAWGHALSADLGLALTAVAQTHPGRLMVAMTLSRDAADRLLNDPSRGTWLGKLLTRRIDFDALTPEVLADLLRAQVARQGYRMEPAAEQRATKRLKAMAAAADFDNATAVRRLADDLAQHAATRTASSGQGDRYTIAEADVRALG